MKPSATHLRSYDRAAAAAYARKWAYGRNPAFYDYDKIGGDCTNFASQCLYAGSGVMNETPTFGWYYHDANRKAPAWTGVPFLRSFLLRQSLPAWSPGPIGEACAMEDIETGDILQLSFTGAVFQHCPVVVSVGRPATPENILLAAHSYDALDRPLSTYSYQAVRFVHITGVVLP